MDHHAYRTSRASPRLAKLLGPALAVLLAGCGAAAAPARTTPATHPAAASTVADAARATPTAGGLAGLALPPAPSSDVAVMGTVSGGTTASTGPSAAIAYPYPVFGGSPGLAPEHELVVGGTGWAPLRSDQSNRSAAERSALDAAMAEAKVQAEAAARDASVTLGGVLSVSVTVGGGYVGIVPLNGIEAPGAPSAGGAPSPAAVPANEQLDVSVTVAYSIS